MVFILFHHHHDFYQGPNMSQPTTTETVFNDDIPQYSYDTRVNAAVKLSKALIRVSNRTKPLMSEADHDNFSCLLFNVSNFWGGLIMNNCCVIAKVRGHLAKYLYEKAWPCIKNRRSIQTLNKIFDDFEFGN